MTTKTSLKGQVMRLAKDFSNINDFAYFTGGQIVTGMNAGGRPSVALNEGASDSYAHGGYYVVLTEDGFQKWHPYEFEEMFESTGDLERIPEGWSAYPEGSDLSEYGKVVTEYTRDEVQKLIYLVRLVKEAGSLTRKRRIRKLHESELFQRFSKAVNGTDEPVELEVAVNVWTYGATVSAATKDGTTVAFFCYDNYSKYVVVTDFSVSTAKVLNHLNRTLLTKP